jgi:DNA-directed RNA polymerase specialized sigma24 family protein
MGLRRASVTPGMRITAVSAGHCKFGRSPRFPASGLRCGARVTSHGPACEFFRRGWIKRPFTTREQCARPIIARVIGAAFQATLAKAQDGDDAAFTCIFRDVQPVLVRYLRVVAPDAADDVAGDTWVHVVDGLTGFRGDEAAFRAWLFTIARHRAVDRGRWPQPPVRSARAHGSTGAREPATASKLTPGRAMRLSRVSRPRLDIRASRAASREPAAPGKPARQRNPKPRAPAQAHTPRQDRCASGRNLSAAQRNTANLQGIHRTRATPAPRLATLPQVAGGAPGKAATACKQSAPSRGAAPHPNPLSEMGKRASGHLPAWIGGALPRNIRGGKGHIDQRAVQTLAARRTRGSPGRCPAEEMT